MKPLEGNQSAEKSRFCFLKLIFVLRKGSRRLTNTQLRQRIEEFLKFLEFQDWWDFSNFRWLQPYVIIVWVFGVFFVKRKIGFKEIKQRVYCKIGHRADFCNCCQKSVSVFCMAALCALLISLLFLLNNYRKFVLQGLNTWFFLLYNTERVYQDLVSKNLVWFCFSLILFWSVVCINCWLSCFCFCLLWLWMLGWIM